MSEHNVALPTFSEDEQTLELLKYDLESRLLTLQRQKAAAGQKQARATQLEQLTEALQSDERSVAEFEHTIIPAAAQALDKEIEARYTAYAGRPGMYGQREVSLRVNNTAIKLIGLKDNLLQRRKALEGLRARHAELKQIVEGDQQ